MKDKWGENLFQSHAVTILGNTVTLLLYEQNVELGGYTFREIRCFNESGHQTAIITTNEEITLSEVASKMFSRWSQENFLKYLIADYDFDKMIQYGSEAIDENRKIVNPEYRKINHKIKELAEKIQRKEAKFYKVAEQINEEDIDEIPTLTRYQIQSMGNIIALKKEREALITERSKMQSKIMLKEMPDVTRLNKLKPEK